MNNATVTAAALLNAFNIGMEAMAKEAEKPEAHWYPCGFAWIAVKIRKNNKLAKTFLANGWRWDDYAKAYTFRMPADMYKVKDMWQSMDYAARCLNAMCKELTAIGVNAYVDTRID